MLSREISDAFPSLIYASPCQWLGHCRGQSSIDTKQNNHAFLFLGCGCRGCWLLNHDDNKEELTSLYCSKAPRNNNSKRRLVRTKSLKTKASRHRGQGRPPVFSKQTQQYQYDLPNQIHKMGSREDAWIKAGLESSGNEIEMTCKSDSHRFFIRNMPL